MSGRRRAARLLHRRERHAGPAVAPRAAHQSRHGCLAALGDNRLNGGDAEHHRVAHDVVHLVGLQDGLSQRERHRRFRGRLDTRQQLDAHVTARGADDARQKLVAAAVEDRHRVADAEPQHPRQVFGFVSRQHHRLVTRIQRGREEPVHGTGL